MVRLNDFHLNLIANSAGHLQVVLTEEQLRDKIEERYNMTLPMGHFTIKKVDGDSWQRVYTIRTTGKYRVLFHLHDDEEYGQIGIGGELLIYIKGVGY